MGHELIEYSSIFYELVYSTCNIEDLDIDI